MNSDFSVAVHALVYLYHKQATASSEELAGNVCTNPARVRKVMSRMCKADLVSSKEGNPGGYLLTGNPDLRQIFAAVCDRMVSTAWHSGDTDMNCMVASGMAEVMDGIYDDLNEQCMKHLSAINIGQLNDRLQKRAARLRRAKQ